MHQVVEVLPSLSGTSNESLLKTEIDHEQPTISLTESLVAPPSVTQTQLITVPIVSAQPFLTSTPSATIKRTKRGFRTYLNSKKVNRTSIKPTTVLARPSTIIPYSPKPILLNNQITPIIPKSVTSIQTNPSTGFTTYLVVDGSQGQLVQVSNDGQKPVTFRNQVGQVLQATPITVVSTANQPVISSFPTNSNCSLLSNSSQTITTVRTSSSIDMQQQTTLTNGTTTMTTQQLTGINHQTSVLPTTIINGNNNSSLEESNTTNSNLSLSLTQIAEKVSHRHRRSSSSSTSKKKRGRPRLYERDPLTNKPIKNDLTPPTITTELTKPNITNTTFNTLSNHSNNCSSFIFPNQITTIPVTNSSLLQQYPYSYPSLLNGTTSTKTLTSPKFNTLANTTNSSLSSTTFPYLSQSVTKEYSQSSTSSITPTHNFERTSQTNSNLSNIIQQNSSSSSSNHDIAVHYIGGFVIRESDHPFVVNDNLNQNNNNNQLQCIICQKIDISQRFFDREKKFCSILCSSKSNENKPLIINEPIRVLENINVQQSIDSNINEQIPLPHDHGLPTDPNKWTVLQVGQFIARLTNETIRQAFYESEIDGQALLLITQEHLRDTMKIKLGPSLVISSEITKLRERAKTFSP
ncbi:unnamed protein product [Rotaria sordida]|uniref:SAM domain-containing protein n=1 Tax=Rotaria sordida TaxID=392033 RepID=A0A813U4Z4_9BILA|nr:unnamed protein product [Rotaria sordida]CAF0781742.1 unnamed protein product [Rotaria sordida]CAF0822774.1 unnamed protein product [Rotaria sordida]CAF3787654.1 unnamed protein product [Rotaria sordida]